ncbi:MAG: hypothetical protein KDI19_14215, partial [Pseudomonadales bacterium]|nr:hypothetical protein [Pseudomonadales bacterium]
MTATRFEITAQHDFAEGASFGEHGPYQRIEGRVHFEVDPSDRANQAIVDLEHAINSGDRHVRFSADFSLVTPKEPARGSRKLL